jgi:hypothetical protein
MLLEVPLLRLRLEHFQRLEQLDASGSLPSKQVAEAEYTGRNPSLEIRKEDDRGCLSSAGPEIVTVVRGYIVNNPTKNPKTAPPSKNV